jgi:hypothetical protein
MKPVNCKQWLMNMGWQNLIAEAFGGLTLGKWLVPEAPRLTFVLNCLLYILYHRHSLLKVSQRGVHWGANLI